MVSALAKDWYFERMCDAGGAHYGLQMTKDTNVCGDPNFVFMLVPHKEIESLLSDASDYRVELHRRSPCEQLRRRLNPHNEL